MGARRIGTLAAGLGCIALLGAGVVQAEERVVDQLLEILRQNKQISDQQYRELKHKAEEERQQDMRKVAPPPPPPPPPMAVAPAAPSPTPSADTMRAYYKNGFWLETSDKKFSVMLGGRLQADWNASYPSEPVQEMFDIPDSQSGAEFRRARLSLNGALFGNFDYKIEYDFATGNAEAKDIFIGAYGVPGVQYVRVGHFKEPYSLEELTSDSFTTFMERALPNAFAPSRNMGIAVFPTFFDQRMTASAGGFAEVNNSGFGFGADEGYNITARVTGLPIYIDKGRQLLHLGLSYSYKIRHDINIAFAQKPEAHLFPVNLVNTGNIDTDGVNLINPEVAWVFGPLSLQGEYMHAFVDQAHNANPDFGGLYVQASYFVTPGDMRAYRPEDGAFGRPTPVNNFSIDGQHWGAWELAARFSRLDLGSHNIEGGTEDDVTGGINWYLNPVTRITINYVWAHLESVGDSNIVQGRFQLSF